MRRQDQLSGAHQIGLVVAKGQHQIAFATLVQLRDQPLQGGHGIHHSCVVGIEHFTVAVTQVRTGPLELLATVTLLIEGAMTLHGYRIDKLW